MRILSIIFHILLIIVLTIITQIGGIVRCLSLIIAQKFSTNKKNKFQVLSFFILCFISTFLLAPPLANQFGRTPQPIFKSSNLAPHTYLTVLLNRHYVTSTLKNELIQISDQFEQSNPNIKTVYLDANFPFFDGFPLLPHLSHNDGKKVDLAFQYSQNGILTNKKPANSGYGHYQDPNHKEVNQPQICLNKGYWQYDFPKYLTLGSSDDLTFELSKTKELIDLILKRKHTQKVFIELHLKSRMKIDHKKLRFHGCQAVRHDDHIHLQIN